MATSTMSKFAGRTLTLFLMGASGVFALNLIRIWQLAAKLMQDDIRDPAFWDHPGYFLTPPLGFEYALSFAFCIFCGALFASSSCGRIAVWTYTFLILGLLLGLISDVLFNKYYLFNGQLGSSEFSYFVNIAHILILGTVSVFIIWARIRRKSRCCEAPQAMSVAAVARWLFLVSGIYALACVPAILLAERFHWPEWPFHVCLPASLIFLRSTRGSRFGVRKGFAVAAVLLCGLWLLFLAFVVLAFNQSGMD
jgi:hypothetical protein